MKSKIILCLLSVFLISNFCGGQKKSKTYPLVKIRTIEQPKGDTVRLNAFVVDVYVCPPCPPPAQCKPCIKDNFTVADRTSADLQKLPSGERLRIYYEHSDSIQVGQRYSLMVRIINKSKDAAGDADLISFRKL